MRKRFLALLLALAMVLPTVPAALAAEAAAPTPPEWINAEDYVVFEGGKVYAPEYWACVLQLREHAQGGGRRAKDNPYWDSYLKLSNLASKPTMDGAAIYEKSLIDMMYHKNEGYPQWTLGNEVQYLLGQDKTLDVATQAKLKLWSDRWVFQTSYYGRTEEEATVRELPTAIPDFVAEIGTVMAYNGMTSVEQFLDCGTMDVAQGMETYGWMSKAGVVPASDGRIAIWLDGKSLKLDVAPEVKNERTMVPIRAVAEALGADVEWVQDKQQVVMTRAGVTVTMTLDSTAASIDDKTVEMDVAPYATNGRTLIPARYVAEFFGQKVDWDGPSRRVLITEDKSVAGDSNLEAWALPMGAMLAKINSGDPARFGLYARSAAKAKSCKGILNGGSWNIPSRDDLAYTVLSMTLYGHDSTFREMAADVKQRTQAERDAISAASDAWPSYMWEYTEYVDEKWGDRGIMAWDLFRMSNLVQWGYTAGYVTYEEALALLEPAATLLSESFSSWDEAYENYLDGYNWWARNDVLGQDIWQTERGQMYQTMKNDLATASIFDDALFQTGVIGLPDENEA